MPRLVATVLAVLMLVLTAFAAPGCQSLQDGEEAASFSIMPVAAQAAESLCRAPAVREARLSDALAALDKQADHEDRVEMMAVETSVVRMSLPSSFQGPQPAAGVPAPWLPGPLRPPRTRHA